MSISGKVALLKRWGKMASGKNRVAVKQGCGRCYSKTEIAGYYNDLTGKVNPETLLDENGIPINIIEGNKEVYFPISIFQYALGLWDLYLLEKSEEKKTQFIVICKWITDHQSEDGSWNCFGPIGYKSMTVSSMGQGEAISVLLRAYLISKDDLWLNAAQSAVEFMITDLNNGGTLRIEDDDIVFEEYADLEGSKKSVLNGWIFSLFGVYDYLKIKNDNKIRKIYNNSLNTLKRNLSCYDCGYWSLYDRTGRIASPAYHDLHIELLTVLSDISGDDTFMTFAEKWKNYQKKKLKRFHAITKKVFQKFGESTEGILVK